MLLNKGALPSTTAVSVFYCFLCVQVLFGEYSATKSFFCHNFDINPHKSVPGSTEEEPVQDLCRISYHSPPEPAQVRAALALGIMHLTVEFCYEGHKNKNHTSSQLKLTHFKVGIISLEQKNGGENLHIFRTKKVQMDKSFSL